MNDEKLLGEFRRWILSQKIPGATLDDTGDSIKISTNYAAGEVNFHRLEVVIVEMLVKNLARGEDKFYLHFELKDLNYAQELFGEMVETLLELKNQQRLKILLSCTGGLTTSFFADKLNDAAKFLALDFEFAAVPFHKLYSVGFDYSVILLAPQISYQLKNASAVLSNRLVLKIPPKIFASYDAAALIEFIRAELAAKKIPAEKSAAVHEKIQSPAKILTIALMANPTQTYIAYRIYERGTPIFSETVIKSRLNFLRDLRDILDTVSRRQKFDAIGIAIPGIIRGGHIDFEEFISPDENLSQILRDTYGYPVTISNISNAAVLGYHAQQKKFDNIFLVSHPRGFATGGSGIIVNGKMISGAHKIAGEIKYVVRGSLLQNNLEEKEIPAEKILEFVSLEIRAGMSIVDPELVCVNGAITPDVEVLRAKILEVVPEKYLPEFVYVSDEEMAECILLGQMILSLEELEGKI